MNKLLWFLLPLIHACCPAMAASPVVGYPTATAIRLLKQNLDLNGQVSVLSGSTDPTVVATTAPIGSLYINTTNGFLFRKMDAGSTTNWSLIGPVNTYLTQLLVDGSFEGVTLNSAWVPQGGTMTPTVVTTDYVDGKRALSLSSSGASVSGNLLSQTISTGIPNTDGMSIDLTASFKTSNSNLQMCLGQAGTTLTCQAIPGTGKWVTVSFTAPMPTANINFYVSTTTAGIVDFKIDNAYLGLTQSVGNVGQATIYATMSQDGAASCTYTATTTASESTFADVATAASCASAWTGTGGLTVPASTDYKPTLSVMPQGDWEITVISPYYGGQTCNFKISDGTNTIGYSQNNTVGSSVLQGRITYSSSASRTFKIIASSSAAGTCGVANNAIGRSFQWTFKRFPTSSEQVVRVNNQPVYAGKTWANLSATFFSGVAASTTRNVVTGSAVYSTFGSAVNDASTNVQLTTYMPIGEYEISATGTLRAAAPSGAANAGATCSWDIYDSTAAAPVGGALNTAPDATTATAAYNDLSVVKTYVKITTAQTKTYQLRVAKLSGANASYCQYDANSTNFNNGSIMIRPLNQGVNIVIPGSVTSASTGNEKIERATLLAISNAACTVSNSSSSWITGTTPTAAGDCTITMTGWTTTPVCVASANDGSSGTNVMVSARGGATSATSATFKTNFLTSGSSTVSAAQGINIICQGPR